MSTIRKLNRPPQAGSYHHNVKSAIIKRLTPQIRKFNSMRATCVEFCKSCGFINVKNDRFSSQRIDVNDDEHIKQQIRLITNTKRCKCGAVTEIRLLDSHGSARDGSMQDLHTDRFNKLLFNPPWRLDRADKNIFAIECLNCKRYELIGEAAWFEKYRYLKLSTSSLIRDGDELELVCGARVCQNRLRLRMAVIEWNFIRWLLMNYDGSFEPVTLYPDQMVGLDKNQAKWASMYANPTRSEYSEYLVQNIDFGAPTGEPVIGVEKW